MEKEKIEEIIKQVLYNPQVSYPPISYSITDKDPTGDYESEYIDIQDFHIYIKSLGKQLVKRLTTTH